MVEMWVKEGSHWLGQNIVKREQGAGKSRHRAWERRQGLESGGRRQGLISGMLTYVESRGGGPCVPC